MKLKKKLVLIMLAVVLCISPVLGTMGNSAHAAALSPNRMKVEYYINSPVFQKYVNGNYYAPYQNYLTEMLATDGFDAGLIAWQTANFFLNPGDLLEGALKDDLLSEKGYYEAMLFELFYEAQRKEAFVDKMHASVAKLNVSTYEDLINAYQSVFEYSFWPSKTEILTDSELTKIKNAILEQEGTFYLDVFGTVENFEKALSSAKTIEAISNKLSTLLAFNEVGKSYVAVLEEMYDICSNEHLKDAIAEMIRYYRANFSVPYIVGKELANLAIDKLADKACSFVWDDVINNLGGGWVKLAADVGKTAVNAWLSTDSYYESFYQMRSLLDIELLVKTVTRNATQEYKTNPTEEKAVFLDNCIDVTMRMYELGYEYSAQYLTMLDSRGIINVMTALGYEGLDNTALINTFKDERSKINTQYSIAEAMLEELCHQDLPGYSVAFDGSYIYDVTSQGQFDIYISLCKDMKTIYPERTTRLPINCTVSVTTTESCDIGPLYFTNLTLKNNEIKANGAMSGKNLSMENSRLEVSGNLTAEAIKKMQSENDLLHVKGDFTVGGTSNSTSTMTDGIVKLEGDFVLSGYCGYNPTENCKTIFCGSELQSVKGKFDRIYNSSLGNVEIQNTAFTMEEITGNAPAVNLFGNVNLENEGEIKVGTLTLNGNEVNTKGRISCSILKAEGTDNTITAAQGVTATTVRVNNSKTIINGNVVGESLYLSNGQLEVGGDLSLDAVKEMILESDLLHVKGDFTVGGTTASTSTMTNGTVKLEGDFTLDGFLGYNPKENCKTIFCGGELQSVKGTFDRQYNNSLGIIEIQGPYFTMEGVTGSIPSVNLVGDVNLENEGVIKAGTLTLNGNVINTKGSINCTTLKAENADNTIEAAQGVTAATTRVTNGKLTVNGDVTGDLLYFSDGQLEVGGGLTLEAIKEMLLETDLLYVKGDFTVGGNSSSTSVMTNGTVKLEGDFVLNGYCGYTPTENLKTIFCGSELQAVKGDFVRQYNNSLGTIEIQTSYFTMEDVQGTMPSVNIVGNVNLENGGIIKAGTLTLKGNEVSTKGSIDCTTLKVEDNDVAITAEKGITAATTRVNNGEVTVNGDVVGNYLYLNAGQLEVGGDLTLDEIGEMIAENTLLRVKGDFTVGVNVASTSTMTHGAVELEGNLILKGTYGFGPTKPCVYVFCGDSPQNISGNTYAINQMRAVINAHEIEDDLTSSYPLKGVYIWDPEYKTGDKYVQLATFADNDADGYEYTGNNINADLTVNYGEKTLAENTDYTVEYTNNKAVGSATANICGINGYKGMYAFEYAITPTNIANAVAESVPTQVYTGEAITPKVVLNFNGEVLKENTDYKLSYANNIEEGTGEITIKGLGNFTGSRTITFNIVPKDNVKITVINNIEGVVEVLDSYYDNSGDIIKLLPSSVTALLDNGTEVELVVSWNCEEYNNAPSASNTFVYTISSAGYNIDENVQTTGSFVIVNKAVSSITIKAEDKTVNYTEAVDVDCLFEIDENAGMATYELISGGTGSGNLQGKTLQVEKYGSFIIKVTTASTLNYEEGTATATLTVSKPKINSVAGPEMESYVLGEYYSDYDSIIKTLPSMVTVETESGSVQMSIQWFCNEYDIKPDAKNIFAWVINPDEYADFDLNGVNPSGEVTLSNKAATDISIFEATLSETTYVYSGVEKRPVVKIGDLIKDVDYTVSYNNNIKGGTAAVVITGTGNYSGSKTLYFTINPCQHTWDNGEVTKEATCATTGVKTITCTVPGCGATYTEVVAKLTNHSYDAGKVTKAATCTQAGVKTYTCTVAGCGATKTETVAQLGHNYSSSYTVDKKATMSENGSKSKHCSKCSAKTSVTSIPKVSSVSLSSTAYTYNGKAQKPSVTVKNSKGTALKNGTDYSVSYASGGTKIGRYKVTVTLKGSYSGSKNLYFTIGPKNPSSVKTTLYGYDDVKVSWSKVSGASGYVVYYKKASASSYTKLKTTTSTSYKKSNLSDGVKYTFKVVAYKTVGGDKCYNAGKTSSITTLKKITGVKAAESSSKVKISWTNIGGETGYQISKSTSKSKTKIVATYKTTSGKSKTISATKGKTYYYKVRAYKVVGDKKIYGPWSSVVKYKR